MDIHELEPARDLQKSVRHPWEVARLCVLDGMFRQCLTVAGRRPVNVLDFGCGDGYVTRRLAEEYPRHVFLGVDCAMDADLAARLQDSIRCGNVRFLSSMESLNRDAGLLDVILLLDVLEHCSDDRQELAHILAHDSVSPHAKVVATAPAFPGLFSSHDRILGHHRRYTRAGLKGVLEDAGLFVEESGYLFFCLAPLRFMRVWMERKGLATPAVNTGVGQWRGGAMKSRLLGAVLSLDCRFLRAMARMEIYFPGLSCYAICRRRA